MKAVILARVSSQEQGDGKSLPAQIERAEIYAKNKHLNVIKTFTLIESSTRGGRKKFIEMIDFVKKQKEPIAIIADTVDRFQRDFKESIEFYPLIQNGTTELHFATTGLCLTKDSKSSEFMMWDFSVVGAKAYIHQLREATKRGVMKKLEDGELATKAPIGYKNVSDPLNRNKRTVIIDEPKALIVKKLFKEYATGLYPLEEITRRAKKYGLKTDNGLYFKRNSIHRMIRNSFYMGLMSYNGTIYKHKYSTIIDKDTFEKCQNIRTKMKTEHPKFIAKPFVFKGILKCSTCGCRITSEIQKNRYVYLFCSHFHGNCNQERIKEEILLQQIEKALSDIKIPEELYTTILDNIKKTEELTYEQNNREFDEKQKELKKIDSKLEGLLDLLLENSITKEQYNKKYTDLNSNKQDLATDLRNSDVDHTNFILNADIVLKLAKTIPQIFKSSKVEEKQQIINLILSNLKLKNKTLEFSYRKPFDLIKDLKDCTVWGG